MSSWTSTTSKTKSWSNYNLSPKRRGSLSIWFDTEMAWEAKPSGQRGRQQAYSDAAIQACLSIKVVFGLPLRQATGFVESRLERVGLDWAVPDFNTLCRPLPGSACLHAREGQKTVSVAIPYRGSSGPLQLLIPYRWHSRLPGSGQQLGSKPAWNARQPLSQMLACVAGAGAALNADSGARSDPMPGKRVVLPLQGDR